MDGFEVQIPIKIPTETCNIVCAMEATKETTLVYCDTELVSVIIDGKITESVNILGTISQIELNCSEYTKNKFLDLNEQQCCCVAAMLFQKDYVVGSWRAITNWDGAVEEVLASYPNPFAITTESTSIQFAA